MIVWENLVGIVSELVRASRKVICLEFVGTERGGGR